MSPLADHHRRHGDGVIDVALECWTLTSAWSTPSAAGARIIVPAHDESDADGSVRLAVIAAYGDTVHTLVDRSRYRGAYLPGYVRRESTASTAGGVPVFVALDHVVGNVELGAMDQWVDFYHRVMGFTNMAEFIGDDIATKYSALMSKVVASGDHRVKFPLNEPAVGQRKSQIDEYLEFYQGPGVQHLALATPDILAAVDTLRDRGVEFLADASLVLHRPGAAVPGSGPCVCRSRNCRRAASWWTATRTVTCCRSSPSQSVTGRPCSSS